MDYIIETDFQGPGFVAVPNHVAQRPGFPPDALGVLVYLASQPRGFIVRWSVVCGHFGIGKDRWQRIARDLREIGAMEVQTMRGPGGRILGRRVLVRWPEAVAEPAPQDSASAESGETRLSDLKPENPAAGKPAKVSRKIRQSEPENPAPYKDQRKKKGARGARASSRRSPLGSGGGPRERLVDGRREFLGPDGRWHRRPAEAADAAQFDAWIASAAGGTHAEKARAS